MRLGWFLGWSASVAFLWVVLAGSFADDKTCTWICFTFGDMLSFLAVPAALVWALGMIALYVVGRLRRRRSPSDAGATRTD
jgi:hypothetical protein